MTAFSVRKDERTAIVHLLNDGGFASPEKLADAVLKESYRLLLEREWFVTVIRAEAGWAWGYGLSATEGAARKLALHGPAEIVKITSGAAKLRELDA